MPKVFQIPEALYPKYHGAGYAIAAVMNSEIIDLVYFTDIDEDFDDENVAQLKSMIDDDRIGPTVRYLRSLGEVFVGICSCYEFVEV